jgi:hypothetical protein
MPEKENAQRKSNVGAKLTKWQLLFNKPQL